MMAGQAFPDLMRPQNMRWDAGGLFGRNTISTTFHRIKVPFQSSVLVQARYSASGCKESYFNVRGTERIGPGSLVELPGYGPLPAAARLALHRIDNVTFQPFELVPIFKAPAQQAGVIFLTALSLSAPAFAHPGWPHHTPPVPKSPGNHYMEGCVYLYRNHTEQYPGLVVGTGAEDYFDSSYGFGDAWSYTQTPHESCDLAVYPGDTYCYPTFHFSHAGLLYHGLSTWDATERYAMYKSHVDDPLTFQDGGQLLYRIGDYMNTTAHTARCGTLDAGPGVHPSGPTQPTNVTSYVWAYTWPKASAGSPLGSEAFE